MIIRVFDLETGGLAPDDGDVIECGYSDILLPERTVEPPVSWLCGTDKKLSPENRAVHHINPALLLGKPAFDGDRLNHDATTAGVTCWAAHNAKFDLQWFTPELPVICTYRSALRAWPEAPGHSNNTLRYWLEDRRRMDSFNHAYATAHRAGPDAYVTAHILRCLLEDGHTGRTLIQWSKEPPLFPRCPVGKHKGKPWAEVDTGWLSWCVKSDLGEDIRWNAQRELDRR